MEPNKEIRNIIRKIINEEIGEKPLRLNVLSPDGIPLTPDETYGSPEEAEIKAKEWVKRYKIQGYYSSPRYGRIPYDEILDYLKLVPAAEEEDENPGEDNSLFEDKLSTEIYLDPKEILKSYLEAALWAEEIDKTIFDIDTDSKANALKDIELFLKIANGNEIAKKELETTDESGLGLNLWLSRNGHGAGFFDEGNDELQTIAKDMGAKTIYVGDSGKVYID